MPRNPEPSGQAEPMIEGRTFDEWRAEYERVATPQQAREMASCLFGYPLGPQRVDTPEDAPEPDARREA